MAYSTSADMQADGWHVWSATKVTSIPVSTTATEWNAEKPVFMGGLFAVAADSVSALVVGANSEIYLTNNKVDGDSPLDSTFPGHI